MASPPPPLSLVFPAARDTRIDWAQLQRVAEIVQGDLDDDGDLEDGEYASVWEMWQHELRDANDDARPPAWYTAANAYWQDEAKCSLDDNGVLGGFAHISPADVADSRAFIFKLALQRPQWKRERVVDCGAGIGRVSKHLLVPLFDTVDLVEQSERLLRGVPDYVASPKLGQLFCMGLQDFEPPAKSYDLIWIQWVSSHLTDLDFVAFLKRCQRALSPHGWIAIKENVLLAGSPYEIDRDDSSMTR
jgi:protein N-terminal methyltransferase